MQHVGFTCDHINLPDDMELQDWNVDWNFNNEELITS